MKSEPFLWVKENLHLKLSHTKTFLSIHALHASEKVEKMQVYIDGGVIMHQFKANRTGRIAIVMGSTVIIEDVGTVTSNQAEYLALIRALKLASEKHINSIHVLSDSELLVKQLTGQYQVRNQEIRKLHEEVNKLKNQFNNFSVEWIPREKNIAGKLLAKETSR